MAAEGRSEQDTARIVGVPVKTADPLEISDDLKLLLDVLHSSRAHPVVKAAGFHALFEHIHPFADGNGRTGRQILNLMLMLHQTGPTR